METKALTTKHENPRTSLFNDLFKPWDEWFDNGIWLKTIQTPSINISENKDHFTVSVAAPGLKKEDFKISVDSNILTISSEKEKESEQKEENYTRKEYNYSSFCRSISLPEDIDKDKITANYQEGILNISIPREIEKNNHAKKYIDVK